MSKRRARHKRRSGVVLIIVLWAVMLLGTLTLVLGRQNRTEVKITKNVIESAQTQGLAEAAVFRAMAELVRDLEEDTNGADDYLDYWCDNPAAFEDAKLGKGAYRVVHPNPNSDLEMGYGLLDECSKLNVNTATKEMLMTLEGMTAEIADAIVDWRDEDDTPLENGAESEYYMSLLEPYRAKNGPFDTLEEMLLVRGVTQDLFYGEDTNQNGMLDVNENDGDESYPPDNEDGKLRRGWSAYLTCYSCEKNVDAKNNNRVNINTATEEELTQALGQLLTPEEIKRIIEARGDQQNAYKSVGDLLASVSEIKGATQEGASGAGGGGGASGAGGNMPPSSGRGGGTQGGGSRPSGGGGSGGGSRPSGGGGSGGGSRPSGGGGASGGGSSPRGMVDRPTGDDLLFWDGGRVLYQRVPGGGGRGGGGRFEGGGGGQRGGEGRGGGSRGGGGRGGRRGGQDGGGRRGGDRGGDQGGRQGEQGREGGGQRPGEVPEQLGLNVRAGQIGTMDARRQRESGEGGEQGPILTVEKFRQVVDKVTVTADQKIQGRVNLNTASETVLKAVLPDKTELAESILSYRNSDKAPFDDLGELLDVQGVDQATFRQICDLFCVRSGSFSGEFIGYLPDTQAYKELRVVLDRTGTSPRIAYWKVVR